MRIIGGKFRGMHIDAPQGRDTRPTTDRVRESLISMVISARYGSVEGDKVLDAFAGSGSLGLELISRGAASALFFEKERSAATSIKKNITQLKLGPEAVRVDVKDVFLSAARGVGFPANFTPFDVVMLDPPYRMGTDVVSELVLSLVKHGLLADSCVVVFERDKKTPPLVLEGFEQVKEKTYGSTGVDVLRYHANEQDEV